MRRSARVDTGLLVAFAYPDRIGRARDAAGRYLLANGRGARFAEPQALAKSEFIVAAELDGAEREARIFLAAPSSCADIWSASSNRTSRCTSEIVWDEREQAVRARRDRRLGALVLESKRFATPSARRCSAPRSRDCAARAWVRCPGRKDLRQWQARVALMRAHAVPSRGALARLVRRGALVDARAVGAALDGRPHRGATILRAWIWAMRFMRA